MTCNVGNLDRLLRISLGFVVLATGIALNDDRGCILIWVGLVPLATGLIGNCPVYSIFSLNTKVKY